MTTDTRRAGAARRWDAAAATYRTDWEGRYGTARSWDDYGPAYRYGWEAAADDRYRGRDYAAAEADLQRDFGAGYGRYRSGHEGHSVQAHATAGGKVEHTWDTFKDAVKEGWDRARTELTGGRRAAGATGTAGAARDQVVEAEGQVRVPVREERLEVETRPAELGAVEIRKTVEAEQQTVPVELEREEVHVERRDVADRPAAEGELPGAFEEGTLRVPVRGEEAVARKATVVTGEVVIDKTRTTETQRVTDTLRKERVEVDDDYERSRAAYQQAYAGRQRPGGLAYEQAEPHFREGYGAGLEARRASRSWEQSEADLRARYRAAGADDDAWERIKREVREGFDRARGR